MTNDFVKNSKLLAYQLLKHPGSVGIERSYFEKEVELCKKKKTKPLEF